MIMLLLRVSRDSGQMKLKIFRRHHANRYGQLKDARSFRHIRVLLSQHLVRLRTENCAVCFATTVEATHKLHEATVE